MTAPRRRAAPRAALIALAAGVVLSAVPIRPAAASEADAAGRLDAWITRRMTTDDVPGLAIVVLKDGDVIYRAGHGVEDLATGRPVTPDRTRFHLGSISKPLTATEVMRQVQDGVLALDVPVDRYLGAATPPGQPPTLRQLLSHAGGYEQQAIGTGTADPDRYVPLADHLASRPPRQVVEPGTFTIYSSAGIAVAGLVLEHVTGQRFEEVMSAGILSAAGMADTSFPTPPDDPATAIGHRRTGAGLVAYREPYFSLLAPGGDVVSTADDMARFLQVHLEDGILDASLRHDMHQVWIRNHPSLRGRSIGFSEWRDAGRRGLFQDGGAPGTLSRLFLMPQHDLGMFVAHTNGEAYDFNRALTAELVEMLDIPTDEGEHPDRAVEMPDLDAVTGSYRDYTTSGAGLGRLAQLLHQTQVKFSPEGLHIRGRNYQPATGGVLTSDGGDLAAFREDPSGVEHLVIGPAAYRKVSWWQRATIQFAILALAVATAVVAGIVGAARGLRRTFPPAAAAGLATTGLAVLAYTAGAALMLAPLVADPWQAVTGGDPWRLRPLALVLVVGLVAAAASLWHAYRHETPAGKPLILTQLSAVVTICWWSMSWGLA